jgi:hypothetical protein
MSFRRKVAAIGGMSAQIPIKGDEKANEVAMDKVRQDKLREVTNGHDGTWIAHPLINKIAREIFDQHMLGPNQVCICPVCTLYTVLSPLRSTTSGARTFVSPLPTCWTPRCPEGSLPRVYSRTSQLCLRTEVHGSAAMAAFP